MKIYITTFAVMCSDPQPFQILNVCSHDLHNCDLLKGIREGGVKQVHFVAWET